MANITVNIEGDLNIFVSGEDGSPDCMYLDWADGSPNDRMEIQVGTPDEGDAEVLFAVPGTGASEMTLFEALQNATENGGLDSVEINFKKSHHYNPFAYIHSEKDILKLVNTLITNTKGEGKGGDDFWLKAETLLYTALIGYIYYEAPQEEQNFATLVEFVNAMEVREDDETFENNVDIAFRELGERDPNHFAVRQWRKYKLAAGVICFRRLLYRHDRKVS